MTDETTTKLKLDLSAMSDRELEDLIPAIHKEIERRHEQKKREAIEKVRSIAGELGISAEELIGLAAGKRQERRASGRGVVAWRHPEDASLIYRGGRKPDWLVELEQEGRKAERVG